MGDLKTVTVYYFQHERIHGSEGKVVVATELPPYLEAGGLEVLKV
jgi:hypothetical protein